MAKQTSRQMLVMPLLFVPQGQKRQQTQAMCYVFDSANCGHRYGTWEENDW